MYVCIFTYINIYIYIYIASVAVVESSANNKSSLKKEFTRIQFARDICISDIGQRLIKNVVLGKIDLR